MIARLWRGWTHRTTAQSYSAILRNHVLRKFNRIHGYLGGYVFRRPAENGETEFTVLMLFKDIEAAAQSVGQDGEQTFVPYGSQTMLSRFEPCASQYEVVTTPKQVRRNAWLQRVPRHRIEWHW